MKNKNVVKPKKPDFTDKLDATAKEIGATISRVAANQNWSDEKIRNLTNADGKTGIIPIEIIQTHKNIRQEIDENDPEFKELIESIKEHGIVQLPIVTVLKDEKGNHYVHLVGGERRLRAARALGHKEINCLVRIFNEPTTVLTASMAENMNRKDLNPLDMAHCFLNLHNQGYKYSEINRLFGRNEKVIGRFVKIAKWPMKAQQIIRSYPEKFNTKYLFTLASRTIEDHEVIRLIELKAGTKEEIKARPPEFKSPKHHKLLKKFDQYCIKYALNAKEKELILRVFDDLGIVSNEAVIGFISKYGTEDITKKVSKGDTLSPN